MKRFVLVLLLGAVALVLLAVVAAGIFLSTLDLNDYKDRVEEAVARATGRHLVFEGDITHSLFPLGLKTGRAYIRDEDIYGADPLLSVEGVSLKADLSALARGEILVEELTLNGLAVKLAVSATGEKNWEHAAKKSAVSAPSATGAEGAAGTVTPLADDRVPAPSAQSPGKKRSFTLLVTSIKANDARIAYRDMRNNTVWDLEKANLAVGNVGKNTDMDLSLTGLLTANGHAAEARLEGTARFSSDGNVQATVSSLRIVNQPPGGALPEFSITAALFYDAALKNLSVNDLNGTLDTTPFSGTLAAILPGGTNLEQGMNWDIRGELHLGPVDADALQTKWNAMMTPPSVRRKGSVTEAVVIGSGALPGNQASGKPLTPRQSGNTATPPEAPLKGAPGLDGVFAELAVTVERVGTKGFILEKITANPTLNNGKLDMPYAFSTLGGSVSGTASASLLAERPSWRLLMRGEGLKAELLPMQAAKQKRLMGNIQVSADISGRGLSKAEATPTLSGTLSAALDNGHVQGFNVIPPEIAARHTIPEDFPLERASFSAAIKDGVAVTRDIRLVSPLVTGTGAGSVNLSQETVSADVDFMAHRPPAVPLMVRGGFADPVYSIDMEKLAVNAAKAGLESGDGRKLLKKLPPEVGKVLQDEQLIRSILGRAKK